MLRGRGFSEPDNEPDEFDAHFKRVGRLAVFGAVFGAVVVLAVLGLITYVVFKLV